jgi:hypothetical protein
MLPAMQPRIPVSFMSSSRCGGSTMTAFMGGKKHSNMPGGNDELPNSRSPVPRAVCLHQTNEPGAGE